MSREEDLIKLEKARDLITHVIFENKDNWDKQYKWLGFLFHGQGALKDCISHFKEKDWEIKKPLIGEK